MIYTLFLVAAIRTLRLASSSPALDCDFESGTLCLWRSEAPGRWFVQSARGDDLLRSSSSSVGTTGSYAMVQGMFGFPSEARLISPEVPALSRTAQLTFTFWKATLSTILDICVLDVASEQLCLETLSAIVTPRWTQHFTQIPPTKTPFRVLFRVRNVQLGIDRIGIDNIRFAVPISGSSEVKNDLSGVVDFDTPNENRESNLSENNVVALSSPTKSVENELTPSEVSGQVGGSCQAVKCSFLGSLCSWKTGSNWRRLEGNLAIDREGEHIAQSALFIVPLGAFCELDVWMSDNARLTIEQASRGGESVVVWSRKGLSGGDTWHRLRLPLRALNVPNSLVIKANLPPDNFVAISNIKMVNGDGNEIGCDVPLSPIRPLQVDSERLTAYQRISSEAGGSGSQHFQIEKTASHFPVALPAKISEGVASVRKEDDWRRALRARIRPQISRSSSKPLRNEVLGTARGESPSEDGGSAEVETDKGSTSLIKNVPLSQSTHWNVVTDIDKEREASFRNESTLEGVTLGNRGALDEMVYRNTEKEHHSEVPKSVTSVSGGRSTSTASQVALEQQLKQLAQEFGFSQITGQQGIELLRRLLSSKNGALWKNSGASQRSPDLSGLQPIQPVNAPASFKSQPSSSSSSLKALSDLLPRELTSLASWPQQSALRQNFSGAFLSKVASILSPPTTHVDAQRPLARQNLDFIVQNANSA